MLRVYKYSTYVAELEKRNREQLEEWRHAKTLSGELILLLSSELTVKLCGFCLAYDEHNGLPCRKEE